MSKMSWLFAALFLVAVAIVGFSSAKLGPGYEIRGADAAAATVASLLTVTLFVERGMTVINAIVYGDQQRTVEVAIANLSPTADADLAAVSGNKERVRLLGAFIAGLFVSAAGVRCLGSLLLTNAEGAQPNWLLAPVDVVLTAALIAGGSNGLAYLLQLAKNRLAPAGDQQAGVAMAAAAATGVPPPAVAIDPNLRSRLITSG